MIKKIILWFLLILLILLAILSYIGYRSFNQEAFKNQIVQNIQELTGRDFTVNGPYQLAWNPLPTMTLENVTLANIDTSPNKEMFKADKIQIQIEWASLLKSPTRIKNIIVVNPQILIERIGRSVTNINFPQLFAANDTLNNETLLGEPRKQAKIDNIHIENGSIQYINQMTKQSIQLSQLTGEVAVGSLNGPFGFEGKGVLYKVPVKISGSIGAHDVSKPIDFLTELIAGESDSHIKLDGQLFPEDPEKYMAGHMAFETPKPNTLLRQMGLPQIPSQNNKTTVGNLAFEMNAKETILSDGVFRLGDAETDPAISLNLVQSHSIKNQQLTMDISRLNLDDWAPSIQTALEQKLLSNMNETTFTITVANVLWHQQPATTLQLNGIVSADQIQLNNSSILLEGSTTVQIDGLVSTDINNWNGLAQINLQSQNLAQALPFLNLPKSKALDLLTPIKKAEINSSLEWAPNSLTITIPALMLDDTTGIAQYQNTPEEPTTITLELNNINFNTYIQNVENTFSPIQLRDMLYDYLEQTQIPAKQTNIELTLNNARLKDTEFSNITTNIQTENNTTIIEAVADTINQDNLMLQAQIQNMGTPNWQIIDSAWEASGQHLPQLLHSLGVVSQDKLLQSVRNYVIRGVLSGQKNQWQVTLSTQTQNMELQANGQIINHQPKELEVHFTHNSLPHLLVDLFEQNPFSLLTGSIDMHTILDQDESTLHLNNFTLTADNQELIGNVTYDLQTHALDIDLSAEALDISKFLPDINHFYLTASGFDGNPLQLDLLKQLKGTLNLTTDLMTYQTSTFKNAKLKTHIDNNVWTLDDFVAAGAEDEMGSTIQARGSFEFAQMPTFNIQLVTQQLPLTTPVAMFDGIGLNGGRLSSEWNLTSSGETPLQMARTLSGNGSIALTDTTFIGMDLHVMDNIMNQASERDEEKQTFEPKLKHALTNGASPIEYIRGNFAIKDGVWQMAGGQVEIDQADSSSLNISWDIPAAIIRASAPLQIKKYPALPALILDFQKDKRGVNYDVDINTFTNALVDEFAHQKIEREEAAIQAKKQQLEKEMSQARQTAEETQAQLNNLIVRMNQLLDETPDASTQKAVKMAQVTHQNLDAMMQEETLTTTQYQYITEQSQKAINELQKAQQILYAQNIKNIKKKASDLMQPTNDLILKLNEMYQKRPTLTLLADLLQNAEKQREIMGRAIDQFKKDLTFDQVITVADIIQTAHKKIAKAYDYAEEIYSGRQSMPTNNSITKASP